MVNISNSAGKTGIVEHQLGIVNPRTGRPIQVGMVSTPTAITGSDMGIAEQLILHAANLGKYDMVIAPEYTFLPPEGPLTEEEKNQYVEGFRKASENGTLIIPGTIVWHNEVVMHNTAPILYNGRVVKEYDKMKDGGERFLAHQKDLTFMPGVSPGAFQWEGLGVGIEVCADTGYLHQIGARNLDMIILIACGEIGPRRSMPVPRTGGYCLYADGRYNKYTAIQRNTPGLMN